MRYITAALILLICAVIVISQTSNDWRWFDSNPDNDPDARNYCFIYWDCETDADWQNGYHTWRSGGRAHAPPPPTRANPSYGDPNLCWSVWVCKTSDEWQRGWQRGQQIFQYGPPSPSPQPNRETVVVRVVKKAKPALNCPTPNPKPTPDEFGYPIVPTPKPGCPAPDQSPRVQAPGKPENRIGGGDGSKRKGGEPPDCPVGVICGPAEDTPTPTPTPVCPAGQVLSDPVRGDRECIPIVPTVEQPLNCPEGETPGRNSQGNPVCVPENVGA